ncbi:hypothetical protein ACFYNX_26445 [Streptomyces sp. NPDC007872]|uniref:hypothetical protein n=1 Tax=Streptomyces sp. NPDC007872 TaxID=3364782 RepID=UPI0036AE916C
MTYTPETHQHAAQMAWHAARDAYRTLTACLLIQIQPLLRRELHNEEAPWSHLVADLPDGGRVTIQLIDGSTAQAHFTGLHQGAVEVFTSRGRVHFGDIFDFPLAETTPSTHTRHLYRATQRIRVQPDGSITGDFTLPIPYLMHALEGLTELSNR